MLHLKSEYNGGYIRTKELEVMIQALREKALNKDDCRLLAAMLLSDDAKGRVTVDYLVNGIRDRRRVSGPAQGRALIRIKGVLAQYTPSRELTHKISRKFLKTMAAGRMTVARFATGLYYFQRRKPQRKRRNALLPGERYGRFTMRWAAEAIGRAVCTVFDAVHWLRRKGIISRLMRPDYEVLQHGSLYVDGPRMSLASSRLEEDRQRWNPYVQKTRTPGAENQNNIDRTPLSNSNSFDSTPYKELHRIRERAKRQESMLR